MSARQNIANRESVRMAAVLLAFFVLVSAYLCAHYQSVQYYVYQADAFWHGQMHYAYPLADLRDTVTIDGRHYLPLAPLPAVMLMPLVALFGILPFQSYLMGVMTALTALFAYQVARRLSLTQSPSIWLALAFTFGSVYAGVAYIPFAGQFATATATVLGLAALGEYLGQRRFWLVGMLLAGVLASRPVAVVLGLFFILDTLWGTKESGMPAGHRLARLYPFIAPVALVAAALMYMNYVRFGSMWDFGYAHVDFGIITHRAELAEYGLFSWRVVPSNLYHYFLALPEPVAAPDSLGLVPPYLRSGESLSFFFVSPIFLWLFASKLASRRERFAIVAAGCGLVALLMYFALNIYELGPRYIVDILPLLYFLLCSYFAAQPLIFRHRLVIVISLLANLYFTLGFSKFV